MSDRDQQDGQLAKQAAAFHVQVEAAKAFDHDPLPCPMCGPLSHQKSFAEGERVATERIERLIEASEPRSYQSRDCGTVHTDTAFEDWRDELLAAIREGRA